MAIVSSSASREMPRTTYASPLATVIRSDQDLPPGASPGAGLAGGHSSRPRSWPCQGPPDARLRPTWTPRRPRRIAIVDVTDDVRLRAAPAVRRSRASTTARATTGRTPTAARRRSASTGSSRARRRRPPSAGRPAPANPFLADLEERTANPFAPRRVAGRGRPTRSSSDDDAATTTTRSRRAERPEPTVADGAPRKLRLLGRGLGVAGSYAKVLLRRRRARRSYCQFGPLTAYPRAQRTRDLYPALPDAPLPGGHHLHRHDGRGAGRRAGQGAGRGGLRRPRRRAASPRSRRTPRSARARTRPAPRRRRSGSRSGSSSPPPTSASRSCAASSRDAGPRGLAMVPSPIAGPRGRSRPRRACIRATPRRRTAAAVATPGGSTTAPSPRHRQRPRRRSPARRGRSRRCSSCLPPRSTACRSHDRMTGDGRRDRRGAVDRPVRLGDRLAVAAPSGRWPPTRRRLRRRDRRPAPTGHRSTTRSSAAGATRSTRRCASRPAASTGHAEAEIAGHQTFIGTCAGGVHTYHVHLPDRDVIVSMQGAGEGRFGELVVAGLTE